MGAKKGLLPWVVGVLVLGVLGLVMYDVRIYTDRAYVCENTGSHYGFREWPNGARTRHWYRVSLLEEFMEKEYPGIMRHRWTSYAGTGKNLIGTPRSFGHGSPGGAYWLKEDVLRKWMGGTRMQKLEPSTTSSPRSATRPVKSSGARSTKRPSRTRSERLVCRSSHRRKRG